jgi:hypothetical protein
MPKRRYQELKPISRRVALRRLADGAPNVVSDTLFRLSCHDADWQWVRDLCVEHLTSREELVRYAAAACIERLATEPDDASWSAYVARLRPYLSDPQESVVDSIQGALGLIDRMPS